MSAEGWQVKYKVRDGFRGISWKGTASRGRLNYFASGNSLDDVMRPLLSMTASAETKGGRGGQSENRRQNWRGREWANCGGKARLAIAGM